MMDLSGSSFPVLPPLGSDDQPPSGYPYPEGGLTKREYVAIAAMQGLLSRTITHPSEVAETSVRMADALLKKLVEPVKMG